ncbi:MAG: hypothetical protein LBI36_06900, partial [Oscillospiraceae bacterium]|nr:hypothetical protein [Oscillospiraceae bacterium]
MTYDYVPVVIDNLPLGMNLECRIYFQKAGELSLLCENRTLTAELVERFKKIMAPEVNVYVPKKYITDSFDKGVYFGFSEDEARKIKDDGAAAPSVGAKKPVPGAVEFKEVVRRYNEVKEAASDMLTSVSKSGKVEEKQGEEISENIQAQLEKTDVSLIIQSINRIRSVDEYLHTHSVNVAFLNG